MHNEVQRSTVHGHVVQAHEIGELHVHGNEVPHPPLTSWQDRPALTEVLEDLLHVQRDAAETLPYRLLGVKQPELTRVYVQQSVRDTEQQDRPVPIGEVLARGKHLLITGEPGAGKSTLGQMYVQRLATEWLEPSADPPLPEPVMPLRIPAKALADDLPWSDLLANAARDRRLNSAPKPEQFARRALGARWLVFVDGLDEIAEPERRDRVIDALVSRMRRGSDHRLVITTRPLPPDELRKLHNENLDSFTIQPFGPVELREFASGWFRAQDPTRATQRAEEFVSQVHDGRLRDLVRNPLLATIAAIANTLEPNRKLPHNRADLYARFMSYLLDDRASGRTTLAELHKAHAGDPHRVEQIEWLYEQRQDLIAHLAVERLESERPLLEVAMDWIAGLPVQPEDLFAVLVSTGVFVHGDEGLKFLHHSFAEFLAAQVRAASIPADFPNLDEWVERATRPASETSVLFTFALWGRKGDHDLDLVLERLLQGGTKHVLLAGRLLAEDVAITRARAGQVVDRLVKLVLANGVRTNPWRDSREISRVLSGLDNESIASLLIPRLRDLRDNPDLPRVVRIHCAITLGILDSAEVAVRWLREFAEVLATDALCEIAVGLATIVPNGAELAEELLLRLVDTTNSYTIRMTVIDILSVEVRRREPARRLLRDLVLRLRSDTSIDRHTVHVPHFGTLPDTQPYGWEHLCFQSMALGCDHEALWVADRILTMFSVNTNDFESAVDALMRNGGARELQRVATRAWDLTLEHVLIVAERTSGTNYLDEEVARHPSASDEQFVRACKLMAYRAPEEVRELVADRHSLGPDQLIELAGTRATYGRDQEGLVRRALSAAAGKHPGFLKLVTGVLNLGYEADDVQAEVLSSQPAQRAEAATVLFQAGYLAHAEEVIDSLLLDEPIDAVAAVDCLNGIVTKKIPQQAQRLFDRVVAVQSHHPLEVARRLAPILQRIGHLEQAAGIAVGAFLRSLGGTEVRLCAKTVLDVSGSAHADLVVAKVRESNLVVRERMDVAELFLDHGLLDHAVMLWLDVVRNHGVIVDKGIEAASNLVKVGQRAQAIEAAGTNRALKAWLEA